MQARDEKTKAEIAELYDKYNKQSTKIFKTSANIVTDELTEDANKEHAS